MEADYTGFSTRRRSVAAVISGANPPRTGHFNVHSGSYTKMDDRQSDISPQLIESRIFLIRGRKVIVDADLAQLYGVSTKRLNEQVKRNQNRFPNDFSFRLTENEKSEVVANCDHLSMLKYSSSLPRVFTEHGTIMAANVLKSEVAVQMSVFVVRAFVNLRQSFVVTEDLKRKMASVESRLSQHDGEIVMLIDAIKKMLSPTAVSKDRQIGFKVNES